MITPQLRPRLEMHVPLTSDVLTARLRDVLDDADCQCRGLVADDHFELRIRESQRHFWSPQLVVIVKPEESGSQLIGHFGPNANVWTLFMACYGFVVLSAVIAVFYGLSQLVLGDTAWALWAVPIAAMLIVLIYIAAGIGQRLGHAQVEVLHDQLLRALDIEQGTEHDI